MEWFDQMERLGSLVRAVGQMVERHAAVHQPDLTPHEWRFRTAKLNDAYASVISHYEAYVKPGKEVADEPIPF